MPSPHVIHWDDVEPVAIDRGELQGQRWRLGAPAGAARVGMSRYRMAAGERCMPAHVHADEEEIFYVLAGSGLSWQDGRTYTVQAGDCIVHRVNAEAHTLVAGDGGLDVLVFAEGSETNITYLPRANAWWLGPRWLPADGPNPFQLEVDAGPLELPEPESDRPPTIVALEDAELSERAHGRCASVRRDYGDVAGSVRSGLGHLTVAPGKRCYPHHCHSAEEELFVVLEGDGNVRLGDEEYPVRAGSVVARPPRTGVGHQFIAGDDGLVLLAYGTRDNSDVCYYPDSNKFSLRGIGVLGRIEILDYWDGEE